MPFKIERCIVRFKLSGGWQVLWWHAQPQRNLQSKITDAAATTIRLKCHHPISHARSYRVLWDAARSCHWPCASELGDCRACDSLRGLAPCPWHPSWPAHPSLKLTLWSWWECVPDHFTDSLCQSKSTASTSESIWRQIASLQCKVTGTNIECRDWKQALMFRKHLIPLTDLWWHGVTDILLCRRPIGKCAIPIT